MVPATFNTINKWAQGISDTLALGLLNEAVGLRLPMVAVPWPNAALAAHPVFVRSVATLREWGVALILDPARLPQPGAARNPPRSRGTSCAPCCPASVRSEPNRRPASRPRPAS